MNKRDTAILKHTVKYAVMFGLVLGGVIVIMSVLDYTIGFRGQNKILTNLNYLFRIIGLFFAILIYRNRVLKGFISFERAFAFGLFTFVFAMFLVDTVACIIFNINPDLLQAKIALMREQLYDAHMSNELIEGNTTTALLMKNPYYILISFAVWVLFIGPVISFATALMLMTKPKSQPYVRKVIEEKDDEFDTYRIEKPKIHVRRRK